MVYHFATEKEDYTHLASGHVFYSAPNMPVFPVRLASELFQRCLALQGQPHQPLTLYDPCCGSAYHLAVLGMLHRPQIATITASDIEPTAVALARKNLSLLTAAGLAIRRQQLLADWQRFGKLSHQAALNSIDSFIKQHKTVGNLPTRCFVADATQIGGNAATLPVKIDLVISDLPYGRLSVWQGAVEDNKPVWHLLNELMPVLHSHSVVALATGKGEVVEHEAYGRNGRFRHGKRMITFLKLTKE